MTDAPLKIANYEAAATAIGGWRSMPVCTSIWSCSTNRSGSRTAAARRARSCARSRRSRSWALTGTPVENSPEDLVGIFEFLAPGHLTSDMKPRQHGPAAGDYVLRRTKDKVLTDLPPKLFRDAELELTPEQRADAIAWPKTRACCG